MKFIILVIVLVVGGYFGWTFYKNNIDKGIKVSIESQVVQDAQPFNSDVNLNQDYKAHIYKVKIHNKTEEDFVLLPSEYFRLKSGPNYYELSPDAAVDDPLQGGTIKPGQVVEGQISFHAVQNRNTELQFRTSIESEDWQKI